MKKITEFVLRRPVTTFLVVISLIFFGITSLVNQKMELMSDIDMPMMIITTTYAEHHRRTSISSSQSRSRMRLPCFRM